MDNWIVIKEQLDKPIDPQYLLWLKVRYILMGSNFEHYDSQKALELARECSWPDAKWLVSICNKNGGIPRDKEEVRAMFLEEKDNPVALVLAGCINSQEWELIERSAQMGNAFAQAQFCNSYETLNRTELSITQDEPEVWSYFGICYKKGWSFSKNEFRAKQCFQRAIKLGHISSYQEYGLMFDNSQIEHFVWLVKYIMAGGCIKQFCISMSIQMKYYYEDPSKPILPIIFKIGKLLTGHINVGIFQTTATGTLFKRSSPYGSDWVDNACLAVKLYEYRREIVKLSTIAMIRNRIPRDIYRIINEMVIREIIYTQVKSQDWCIIV